MIKKILISIAFLTIISCCEKTKNNKTINEKVYKNIEDIYIGKVFFSGDELNNYDWIKSEKFKSIDSLNYSIYQNTETKCFVLSIEKFLKNNDVEKFKIIDTINLKNWNSSDFLMKETVFQKKIVIELYLKNERLKKWEFENLQTRKTIISDKWIGIYHLNINEDSEDWEKTRSISISIKSDSIIYEAVGYQLFQKYLLTSVSEDNSIKLYFNKLIDGSESAILKKTTDFGTITKKDTTFIWSSPYINLSFSRGEKQFYTLIKKR